MTPSLEPETTYQRLDWHKVKAEIQSIWPWEGPEMTDNVVNLSLEKNHNIAIKRNQL